jgi:membrane-bound lytic murein transglycosylase B
MRELRRVNWLSAIAIFAGLTIAASAAKADAASDRWVQNFWPQAQAAGISSQTYWAALGNFQPDPSIIPQASNQPEFVRPIWDYMDTMVSETRIENGLAQIPNWGQLLTNLEAHYGVNRYVILAIWGMESAYGAILDNSNIVKPTIQALATLAYMGGSRQRYGEQQLIAALKILQHGDISAQRMTGSWAGAMGHTQFIPTTYEAYAVDWDGDGRRDIWTSPVDALASTAAYLSAMGWEAGKTWGYEVVLPTTFNYRLADSGDQRSLAEWQRLGVTRAAGSAFPRPSDQATLWVPAGANGPAFLLLRNFSVIKRYNNSNSYALAVGHLADRLQGFGEFRTAWPRDEMPLGEGDRYQLQQLLAGLGLYTGPIDAIVGNGTRAAIRSYQQAVGMVADGYASSQLLRHLQGAI